MAYKKFKANNYFKYLNLENQIKFEHMKQAIASI